MHLSLVFLATTDETQKHSRGVFRLVVAGRGGEDVVVVVVVLMVAVHRCGFTKALQGNRDL
ncbi:hypothetical protein E2C01_072328 [Portunus trituberculatus]|uniref:Uncharacterized protein n=1 Tax=Portunus trituberculatus TaxID=210409 RepID=A0A5B7I7G9_PORTR|nr:hypothetical protein [Portunus trituberculatus]